MTLEKATKFINDSFDEQGFLIKDSYYRRNKAKEIIEQFGDELYEKGLYDALLIIAYPNKEI